jgi:hypothetical protein
MITNKIIENKFYLYKGKSVKVKKIHRSSNSVILKYLLEDSEDTIPFNGGELLLQRLYTIGELAKITEKRSDTLRKYEKGGLIPKPSYIIDENQNCYKNWRFYTESEVYDVVSFFSNRTPGRPAQGRKTNIKSNIISLKERVNRL